MFKALTIALLDYEPSEHELRTLSKSVLTGRLNGAISDVISAYADIAGVAAPVATPSTIDGTNRASDSEKRTPKKSKRQKVSRTVQASEADQMFDLVKRRKINRSQLRELFKQVDQDANLKLDEKNSVREWLHSYYKWVHPEDWLLLRDMVAGDVSSDPYLRDILG